MGYPLRERARRIDLFVRDFCTAQDDGPVVPSASGPNGHCYIGPTTVNVRPILGLTVTKKLAKRRFGRRTTMAFWCVGRSRQSDRARPKRQDPAENHIKNRNSH